MDEIFKDFSIEPEAALPAVSRREFLGLVLGTAATAGLAAAGIEKATTALTEAMANVEDRERVSYDLSKFSPELRAELNSPFLIRHPETGQHLNVIVANVRQFLEGNNNWIVTSDSYGGVIEDPSSLLGKALLATRTKRPLIAFDYFGRGKSDSTTLMQEQSLVEGFSKLAYDTAVTIQNFTIPHPELGSVKVEVNEITSVGNSMAASFGTELMRQIAVSDLNIKTSQGILVEPVGVLSLTESELTERFLAGNYNPEAIPRPTLERLLEFMRFATRVPTRDPGLRYARAMKHDFVPTALDTALASNDDLKLVVGHGLESRLCPPKPIEDMLEKLYTRYPGRIKDVPLPGVGHKIGPKYSFSRFVADNLANKEAA